MSDFYRSPPDLRATKQSALDALDKILSCQPPYRIEKVKALREVETAAKRMADNVERWMREEAGDE